MKITMIGSTSTGKTCYMLGMYAFMSMGLRGFTLTASNPDVDLQLMNKWDKLVDEQFWPFGNDAVIDRYLFDFNYGGKQIGGFEWIDYRGGALKEQTTEKEVSELWNVFGSSSCLFVCVSGEFLQESIFDKDEKGAPIVNNSRKNKTAGKLNCNRFNIIINDVKKKINPTNDNPFPVVILITKFDCCMNRTQDEIALDIKELFNSIFVSNSGFLTMICPVSLGKDLIKNEDQDKNKVTFTGEIDPINVHVPVAFAIYSQLYKQASAKVISQTTIKDTMTATTEKLGKDNNWWNQTFNKGKIESHTNSLQASQKQLQNSQEELQKILSNMQLLGNEIQNFPIFIGDREAGI